MYILTTALGRMWETLSHNKDRQAGKDTVLALPDLDAGDAAMLDPPSGICTPRHST
jgi:hypothetical protein